MSYLEQQANKYANKYINKFEKRIEQFNKDAKRYSEEECINIYKLYKKNCIFTNLIRISDIFNNKIYNDIDNALNYAIDKDVFISLCGT